MNEKNEIGSYEKTPRQLFCAFKVEYPLLAKFIKEFHDMGLNVDDISNGNIPVRNISFEEFFDILYKKGMYFSNREFWIAVEEGEIFY